ncbi:MAG: hypothetical protein RMJ17_00370, partial [Candidatus Aenigmarchaeota archaeon]|nr:hypothetical protein [Candidatus Aenigmarchaeota archaeon]MDW7999109.1 hypothetical protein [Thermodesulfovibrio sp.]MDW8149044.1 hypothetical protein [Candidatus Aenigmarchaeota archaeon]
MYTIAFKKLPSDAGVVFEGFEKISIESRLKVKKELEDFLSILEIERKPIVRVIVGEWGEGKTDAFKRYIEPESKRINYLPLFVSASTLSNSFKMPEVEKLISVTPLPSLQFLVALFTSIKSESEREEIPDHYEYSDPNNFVEDSIKCLLARGKKIIVFIDEFEELLLDMEILKKIISGIKEIINGQFRPIYEGGKFEGCLHFVIAATPDAFYRLQVSDETSLIFGGLGRRIGVIYLPEVKKYECIPFMWKLLKYCFDENLPTTLPIKSVGILHGIYRIAHGNLGNIVSKLTRLMNRAKNEVPEIDKMKIIDYELFIDFFRGENIFVYGGSSQCIDNENYSKILSIVRDQKTSILGEYCTKTLNLLIGEYKPFSQDEIGERIKPNYKVPDIINIINNTLQRKLGILRSILTVAKLKEEYSLEEVKNKLSEFITKERDTEILKIDNYVEKIEEVIDRMVFYNISQNNELNQEIYLPVDEDSILSFFEGITEDRATEIKNKFRKLCSDEKYYLASDELLSQIYPTPIPKELDFIKDRELKMKLWREITRRLAEEYRRSIISALLEVFKGSKLFRVSKKIEEKNLGLLDISLNENEAKINTLLYAANGDLTAEDVEEIHRYIKSWEKTPIHMVLIVYTGEITEKAKEKIEEKELGENGDNLVLSIKLHPTLVKIIMVIYRATSKHYKEIEESLLKKEVEKIVQEKIEIDKKLEDWLKDQKSRGMVVDSPILKYTNTPAGLGDGLKFYINFIEDYLTPKEVFDKNIENLYKFVKYGTRIGLFPDIESVKTLEDISKDLKYNGFLKDRDGKYKVIDHPVEKRILKMITLKRGKIGINDLESYFIITSSYKPI